MRIVQISAEFSPLAKAGGLGEVLLGLSRELSRYPELEVDVILPKYDFIDLKKIENLRLEVPDFKCLEKGALHANAMWCGTSEGCRLHLLEARHSSGFFHRGKIYGCEDDIARFIYFSRAALEYLKLKKQPIDILHLHDWHASLCAPLVRGLFAGEIQVKSILLTIHNSEYQGKCAAADLDAVGLSGSAYLTKDRLQDDANPKSINLLKGGIVYADAVNAVSPTYAKELLTREMGFHLEPTFRKIQPKLSGILNGIDFTLWNPASDPALAAHFDAASSLSAIQKAKQANKEAILKKHPHLTLKGPWVGTVTRLVPQKGPELIEEALRQTIQAGGTFLLLGSSPDPKIQAHFEKLKAEFSASSQALLHLNYDEELAHLLFAGLDFTIVPSLFEPCGLTQLIGMRYGTIPIVRSTGGLKDTVFDCEDPAVPVQQRNGFVFPKPTKESLNSALKRAFALYNNEPSAFQSLIRRCMQHDSSWKKPAQDYLKLYRKLLAAASQPLAAAR